MSKKKIIVEEVLDNEVSVDEKEKEPKEEIEKESSILDPQPVDKTETPQESELNVGKEPEESKEVSGPITDPIFTNEKEVPLEKTNRKLHTWGIVSAVIIVLLTGAVGYLAVRLNQEIKNQKETVVEETSVSEITTESDAVVQLTKEEVTLEVLNGSGLAGEASRVASEFEALGYTVSKIGNTTSADYTTLMVGEGLTDKLEVLLKDVTDVLNVASISGEFTDSTASARIILGKE